MRPNQSRCKKQGYFPTTREGVNKHNNKSKMAAANENKRVPEYDRIPQVVTPPVHDSSQSLACMPPPGMDSRNYGLLLIEGAHNWYVMQGVSIMNMVYSTLCTGGAMSVKDMGRIHTSCDMYKNPLDVEHNIRVMKQTDRDAIRMCFDAYHKLCMERQQLPIPSMLPVRVQYAIENVLINPQMYGCVPAVVIPKILYQVFSLTKPPARLRASAPENVVVEVPPAHDRPRVREKDTRPEKQNQPKVLAQAARRVQVDGVEPVSSTPVLPTKHTNQQQQLSLVYTAARRRATGMKKKKMVRRPKFFPAHAPDYVYVGTWIQRFFCGHESHYKDGVRKPQDPHQLACCKQCRTANSKLANWPVQRSCSMDQRSHAFRLAMHDSDLPDPRPPAVSV